MAIEREFKFLATPKDLNLWKEYPTLTYKITQAYLLDKGKAEVRIRKIVRLSDGETLHTLTVKVNTPDPAERIEIERELSSEEFDQLYASSAIVSEITKLRIELMVIHLDDTYWCFDWYEDMKLCVAEFESKKFLPNDLCKDLAGLYVDLGEEVTSNPKYKTKNLARKRES